MPLHTYLTPFLAQHLPKLTDVPADLAPYVHTADASAEADDPDAVVARGAHCRERVRG